MKKAKNMTTKAKTTTTAKAKKTHIALVKPSKSARDPGVGCRPTGVQ